MAHILPSGSSDSGRNSLLSLQAALHYSKEVVEKQRAWGANEAAINAFLLRFLHAERNKISETVAKLTARRIFEHTLPTLTVTPSIVKALSDGAFRILGKDDQLRSVLYLNVKMLGALNLDAAELHRLMIILLEYMHHLALFNAPQSLIATSTYRQEYVLIINEEEADWSCQRNIIMSADGFNSLLSKYYPGFLGLLLFVGASFDVRKSIQDALKAFPEEAKGTIFYIQRSALSQYVDQSVTPTELGGSLRLTNSVPLSDLVLRQWFTLTAFLQDETSSSKEKSAPSRPLYILPPLRTLAPETIVLKSAAPLPVLEFSPASNTDSQFSVDSDTDGLCSLLVDTMDVRTADRTEMILNDQDDEGLNSQLVHHPQQLLQAYRVERAMRKASEERLQLAKQHIPLDPHSSNEIEKALTAIHRDVMTVVAEIISRSQSSSSSDAPPSLHQLMDVTIAGLRTAAGITPAPAAAMASAAAPPQRQQKEKSFCCF